MNSYTHLRSGKAEEIKGKAIHEDCNGNLVSSRPPSKTDLKRLKIEIDLSGKKQTLNQTLLLIAVLSVIGIAAMYLQTLKS